MIKHLGSVKLRQDMGELEIACYPEATHFAYESGRIMFYRVNPKPTAKMHEIPNGTNVLRFVDYRRHYGWINYGDIEFISHRGNILKIENYNR